MRPFVNFTKATGKTTALRAGRLIDANARFLGGAGAYPVFVGDLVEREVDGGFRVSRVLRVYSATELGLEDDIFSALGEDYRVRAGFVLVEGAATDVGTRRLIDSGQNFELAGVRPGMIVYSGARRAVVREVLNPTTLTLSLHIILAVGQRYAVYPGEWAYAETFEEYKRAKAVLLAWDSTEVSRSSTGVAKRFPFFQEAEFGLDIRWLSCLFEARGRGKVRASVGADLLGEVRVETPAFTLFAIAKGVELERGKHELALELEPDPGHSLTLGLLEVFAKETKQP